tara:strand:- start:3119 stop:3748 length:630 start_codon:yes stop_codon:yes gene_type:complete
VQKTKKLKVPDSVIVFDTEVTAWEGSLVRDWSEPWEYPEPIQIGAVKLNPVEGFREQSTLELTIKPKANPELSDYIIALTGISQAEVESGLDFQNAMTELHDFAEGGNISLWSWSNDFSYLDQASKLHQEALPNFDAGFYDIRDVFGAIGVTVKDYSSSTVHEAFDLSMNGQAHQALYDAQCMVCALQYLTEHQPETEVETLFAQEAQL